MITEKYITAIIQLKQLNIAPKINPRTKTRGKNWRIVAGAPSFLFTNGLYKPY